MQIDISLPESPASTEPADVRGWLKQVELAVHHAQKSLNEMENMLKERDEEKPISISGYIRVIGFEPDSEEENDGIGRVDIRIYEG